MGIGEVAVRIGNESHLDGSPCRFDPWQRLAYIPDMISASEDEGKLPRVGGRIKKLDGSFCEGMYVDTSRLGDVEDEAARGE